MEGFDPRMAWMEERLAGVLKMKGDKLRKLVETDEGDLVKKFLDDPEMSRM